MRYPPGAPEPVVHELTQAVIERYAELSGDHNPLHVDAAYAARTQFGGTIAHGPLVLQPLLQALCEWLGTEALPTGCRVSARFRSPVPSGTAVKAVLSRQDPGDGRVLLSGACRMPDGTAAIEANVELPAPPG